MLILFQFTCCHNRSSSNISSNGALCCYSSTTLVPVSVLDCPTCPLWYCWICHCLSLCRRFISTVTLWNTEMSWSNSCHAVLISVPASVYLVSPGIWITDLSVTAYKTGVMSYQNITYSRQTYRHLSLSFTKNVRTHFLIFISIDHTNVDLLL